MDDNCEMMRLLSSSIFLRITLIFGLITSLIALPIVVITSIGMMINRSSKLFHINIIIIFQVHLFGFFIHCFGRIVLHSLDLYNYTFLDYCDMIPNNYRCFSFRFLFVCGLWTVSTTTVPLIIERYIATEKRGNYEKIGKKLGFAMVILQIIITSIPMFLTFWNYKIEGVVLTYCMAIKAGTVNTSEKLGACSLVVQIIARIIFHILFKKNENLRKSELTTTLSNRYSLEQNIKSMRTLKVFANLQCSFLVIHIIVFIIILRFGPEMERANYIALVELNASYPLYAIISIFVVLKKAKMNRQSLRKKLSIHVKTDHNVYMINFKKDLDR